MSSKELIVLAVMSMSEPTVVVEAAASPVLEAIITSASPLCREINDVPVAEPTVVLSLKLAVHQGRGEQVYYFLGKLCFSGHELRLYLTGLGWCTYSIQGERGRAINSIE
jgi:hypothetical protein